MKKLLWWIVPIGFILAILFNAFDFRVLKIGASFEVIVIAVLIGSARSEQQKSAAYSTALYDIMRHEEKLDDLSRPNSKEKPYRKSDGRIWELADAALSCECSPDSQKYDEVVWNRKKKRGFG
jgi:hypothetical protein